MPTIKNIPGKVSNNNNIMNCSLRYAYIFYRVFACRANGRRKILVMRKPIQYIYMTPLAPRAVVCMCACVWRPLCIYCNWISWAFCSNLAWGLQCLPANCEPRLKSHPPSTSSPFSATVATFCGLPFNIIYGKHTHTYTYTPSQWRVLPLHGKPFSSCLDSNNKNNNNSWTCVAISWWKIIIY